MRSVIPINNQFWDASNLDTELFRNGDPVPLITSHDEWELYGKNALPASCWYRNDPALGARFGKLYNWFAVTDPRGLAPDGFRISTSSDWHELIIGQGGFHLAGLRLKSDRDWNFQGGGNNSSGFSAIPGGGRGALGSFLDLGDYANWWQADPGDSGTAGFVFMSFINCQVTVRTDGFRASGLSVRCLAL